MVAIGPFSGPYSHLGRNPLSHSLQPAIGRWRRLPPGKWTEEMENGQQANSLPSSAPIAPPTAATPARKPYATSQTSVSVMGSARARKWLVRPKPHVALLNGHPCRHA